MCGLVGIFGDRISIAAEKAFKDLLYLDVLRGEHSTGAAIVSSKDKDFVKEEVDVMKTVGPAHALFQKFGKFQGKTSLVTNANIRVMIGHNRYATQGAINEENAHPFHLGQVVGAHNGTVLKYTLNKLHEADKYQVDSQIIYSHLGTGAPITDVWEVADGAMALTWYNTETKKMNFIRNKERPLYVCAAADHKTIYWASEEWMLFVALSRNQIKGVDAPVLLKENTLYEFSVGAEGLEKVETVVPPFVKKVYSSYYSGGKSNWLDDWDDAGDYRGRGQSHVVNKSKDEEKEMIYFHITEVIPKANPPHAFGKTSDGREVKINIPPINAKNICNNIIQRPRRTGWYMTNKYFRLWTAGENNNLVCQYNDLTFVKKRETTECFEGKLLSKVEYTNCVAKGCCNCNLVPAWESRDTLRWLTDEEFLCHECKAYPWVEDLIQQYNQQQANG